MRNHLLNNTRVSFQIPKCVIVDVMIRCVPIDLVGASKDLCPTLFCLRCAWIYVCYGNRIVSYVSYVISTSI